MVFRLHLQAFCDALTGLIIGGMLVFGPWAFGSTESWSIWSLNAGGYCLGVLFAFKLIILRVDGGRKSSQPQGKAESLRAKGGASLSACYLNPTRSDSSLNHSQEKTLVRGLAGVCVLIPFYCLVSAVNARATYDPRSGMLEYHECFSWLPHSLDSSATWDVCWRLLSLICWFWAVRDYAKRTSIRPSPGRLHGDRVADCQSRWDEVPTRLAGLVQVLIISGTALALEGLAQRLLRSPKLLFLRTPEIHQDPFTQFATYAYRANAGQYFNLLWPVCAGFLWWSSTRADSHRAGRRLLPWLCVAAMALVPLVAGARTAALIDLAVLILYGSALLVWSSRGEPQLAHGTPSKLATFALIAVLVGLGAVVGGRQLWPRLHEWRKDLAERQQLYDRARLMARDYPIFGTGPGSFEHLYGLYRSTPRSDWPAQLHNDWLETRITFGYAGSALFAAGFVLLVLLCVRRGAMLNHPLLLGLWISVAGCLIEARWDFPLQIYSIQSLLTFWLAVSSGVSLEHDRDFAMDRRGRPAPRTLRKR
jgi:O-antigen ligase